MTVTENFLFREWYKAKRELVDKLGLDPNQRQILDAWFRMHIFEFGQEYLADPITVMRIDGDEKEVARFTAHVRERMLYEMAKAILNKGLVEHERINDYSLSGYRSMADKSSMHGWRFRARALVCGTPQLVGPAEIKRGP